MKKYKIAVLDDYQNVALESADWSVLRDRADIAVFQDHLADPDALIERLLPFDVVCVMRERTPLPRNIIERLPNLKLIASTGLGTRRSMTPPRAIMGSPWFTQGIGRTRRSNLPGR
jgi:phosphoglycerate dehydrogenase-like enzyme